MNVKLQVLVLAIFIVLLAVFLWVLQTPRASKGWDGHMAPVTAVPVQAQAIPVPLLGDAGAAPLETVPQPDETGKDVQVSNLRGIISGRVINEAGDAVEEAAICLTPIELLKPQTLEISSSQQHTETDADGAFLFTALDYGGYAVQATKDGYSEVLVLYLRKRQRRKKVDITLSLFASIAGRVVDQAGRPVYGASVFIESQKKKSRNTKKQKASSAQGEAVVQGALTGYEKSDRNGFFLLQGLEKTGPYRVLVNHDAYTPKQLQNVSVNGQLLLFDLAGRGQVKGRVVYADGGEAVQDYSLVFSHDNWRWSKARGSASQPVQRAFQWNKGKVVNQEQLRSLVDTGLAQRIQDEHGEFTLSNLEAGVILVAVQKSGYALAAREITGIGETRSIDDIVIQLQPGTILQGTIHNERGAPLQNAAIHVDYVPARNHGDITRIWTHSDDSGRFILDNMKSGIRTIAVAHPDYAVWHDIIDLRPGRTQSLKIVLQIGGAIEGQVTLVGQPVPAKIRYKTRRGNQSVDSDEKGFYRIDGLPEENINLTFRVEDNGNTREKMVFGVPVELGMLSRVNMNFAAATASLEGRILGLTPEEMRELYVTIKTAEGNEHYECEVDDKGYYHMEALPAGKVNFLIMADLSDLHAQSYSLQLKEGENKHQDIQLSEGIRLVVDMVNSGEESLIILVVRGAHPLTQIDEDDIIGNADLAPAFTTRSPDGRFYLRGMKPGLHTLYLVDINSGSGDEIENFPATTFTIRGQEQEVFMEITVPEPESPAS
jgi:hypothetical protein